MDLFVDDSSLFPGYDEGEVYVKIDKNVGGAEGRRDVNV